MIWRISWFSVLILCSSICRKIGAFNVEEKIEGFYGITKDYLLPSWVASAFLHFSVCNRYRRIVRLSSNKWMKLKVKHF
jgi:hypothetical protein